MFYEIGVTILQNSQENTCAGVIFLINLQIFTENLGETASGTHQMYQEK